MERGRKTIGLLKFCMLYHGTLHWLVRFFFHFARVDRPSNSTDRDDGRRLDVYRKKNEEEMTQKNRALEGEIFQWRGFPVTVATR